MLYILNKPNEESIRQLAMIGAEDDEKNILFVSDGVFLSSQTNLERFADMDVENFYAARDAVEARLLEPGDDVETMDYEEMAELLEDFETIIML